jgi:hypothetical protein
LTCDFWAENGKRKTTATAKAIKSVALPFGYAVNWTWDEVQEQKQVQKQKQAKAKSGGSSLRSE